MSRFILLRSLMVLLLLAVPSLVRAASGPVVSSGQLVLTLLLAATIVILLFRNQSLKRSVTQKERIIEKSKQEYLQLFYQFKTLLNAISDPIALFNQDYQTVWTNEAYDKEMSSILNGRIDQPVSFFNPYFDADEGFLRDCFNSGEKVETELTTPDQRIWEITAYPLISENSGAMQVIATAVDVTEKRQLREQASRSNLLASLGGLSAGIAHEINNPNSVILLNTSILGRITDDVLSVVAESHGRDPQLSLGGLDYPTFRTEFPLMVERIENSSLRIKEIVEEFRKFVQEEKNQLGDINLNQVVDAALLLLKKTIQKSTHNFSIAYSSSLPLVKGNFQQFQQLVINLVQNACQELENPDQQIGITTEYDPVQRQVLLKVLDTGPGVSENVLPRLTDPMFTTRRSAGHLGLGLSVCEQIVATYNGHIRFDTSPGKGMLVTVSFPKIVEDK